MHDEVHLQATAKASAQEGGFQIDIVRLDTQNSRYIAHRTLLELRGADQQAFAILVAGGEVHWLQRGVSLQGGDVLCLDDLGRGFHGRGHVTYRLANGQHLGLIRRFAG